MLASVAAWGYEFTRELDEDALPRPCGIPYIDTKGATETLALRRGATVIRPGDVYGRESQPWVVRPLEMLRRGRFVLPAPGDGLITPVYVDDLVDAIVRALREPRAAGRAYTVWDGTPVTAREFFGYHARSLGQDEVRVAAARRCCASRRGRSAPGPPPSRSCRAAPRSRTRARARSSAGSRGSASSAAWQPRWVIGPEAMETVNLDRRGGELRIMLNRPDVMNAWDKQFGLDLLAAVEEAAATTMCAPSSSPARGGRSRPAPTCKAGFDPTPEGHPDVRPCCTSATTRSSPGCGGCPSRCWRPSTARPSGSAARWRWPAI